MSIANTVQINVYLLDEGTDSWRPTQATVLGNDLYRILATDNYDPNNEKWEFLPGSLVKGVVKTLNNGVDNVDVLVAAAP